MMTIVGLGYDIHRFSKTERPLWLGGVKVHETKGLDGHSDADVLCHALADAILGAIGEPDIGYWPPPTDPGCEGICSLRIVEKAVELQHAQGRRVFKKVETNSIVTSHLRFLYRGYLQIAALDLTRATQNAMWLITWDPTEPVATRPLAIQQSGTWYTYGLDLPKNVTELYGTTGYIATAYTYSPYGLVTAIGSVTQYIQWSSEYNDTDLGLVYYNYRHYNPLDGRWTLEDPVRYNAGYRYVSNCFGLSDYIGLLELKVTHIRKMYGLHGTYGVIKFDTDNSEINSSCGFPLIFQTIEPPEGRPKHRLMQARKFYQKRAFVEENTELPEAENQKNGNKSFTPGRTCPDEFYRVFRENDKYFAKYVCVRQEVTENDFNLGNSYELHIQGSINVHAGRGSDWSHGCILIGSYYLVGQVSANKIMYPNYNNENPSTNVQFEFDLSDSIESYSLLMSSLACAQRKANCTEKISSRYERIETQKTHTKEYEISRPLIDGSCTILLLWE